MLMPSDEQEIHRAEESSGEGPLNPSSRLHEALNPGGFHLAECIHRLKGLSLFGLNLVAVELKSKKKKGDEFAVSFSSRENKSLPGGICQVRDWDRSLGILLRKAMCSTLRQAGARLSRCRCCPGGGLALLAGRIIFYNPRSCDLTVRSGAPDGWERPSVGWGSRARMTFIRN